MARIEKNTDLAIPWVIPRFRHDAVPSPLLSPAWSAGHGQWYLTKKRTLQHKKVALNPLGDRWCLHHVARHEVQYQEVVDKSHIQNHLYKTTRPHRTQTTRLLDGIDVEIVYMEHTLALEIMISITKTWGPPACRCSLWNSRAAPATARPSSQDEPYSSTFLHNKSGLDVPFCSNKFPLLVFETWWNHVWTRTQRLHMLVFQRRRRSSRLRDLRGTGSWPAGTSSLVENHPIFKEKMNKIDTGFNFGCV